MTPKHRSLTPELAVDIGVAQASHPREEICGDAYHLEETNERLLVAVVDGVGHGPAAAEAAGTFVHYVQNRPDVPVANLLERAGHALSTTRGAVASLLAFRGQTARFAGVGNVWLRARMEAKFDATPTPGVLGHTRGYTVRVFEATVCAGDVLILYSDGLRHPIDLPYGLRGYTAKPLADEVLAANSKKEDDATVVAMRVDARSEDW